MTRSASTRIINRRFGIVCLAVCLTAGARDAAAQAPAPTSAEAQAAAKKALAWHGTFNVGFAIAQGVEEQRGYQLSGTVKKQFADHASFLANASRQYQHVTFPSESLLSDRSSASIGFDMDPSKHTVFMARSMYLRDPLMYVIKRFEQLAGYGYEWVDPAKKRMLQLVPGISIFKQDLTYSDNTGWESGWGFYEKFEGEISPTWSLSNSFRYRHNFKNFNRSVEAIAALQGKISKPLSLQIEYQWNHESVVPEGFPQFLSVLSVGLRFQF
jgi:putative salt-induced outer membrane protein YdiY